MAAVKALAAVSMLMALVVMFAVASQYESHSTDRQLGLTSEAKKHARERIALMKTNVWRVNLKFDPVKPEFDQSSRDYRESLYVLAVPGFALCVVSLSVCCAFDIMRCCCNRCGGKHPAEDGYNSWQRFYPKAILSFCFVCLFVVCMMGGIGNHELNDGVEEISADFVKAGKELETAAAAVRADLTTLDITGDNFVKFKARTDDIVATSTESTARLDGWEYWRWYAITFSHLWILILGAVSMIGAWWMHGWAAAAVSQMAFFGLALMWLLFGFHFPISVATSDLCAMMEHFILEVDSNPDNMYGQHLATYISCPGNGTMGPLRGEVDALFVDKCSDLGTLTGGTYDHNSVGEGGSLASVRDGGNAEHAAIATTALLADSASQQLKTIYSCQYMASAVIEADKRACGAFIVGGLDLLMASQFFCAILLVPITFFSIIGFKRFNPDNRYGVGGDRKYSSKLGGSSGTRDRLDQMDYYSKKGRKKSSH